MRRKRILAGRQQASAARALLTPGNWERWMLFSWDPGLEGIAGLAERCCLHFYDAAHIAGHQVYERLWHCALPAEVWTYERITALGENELLERLHRLGVRADRDALCAAPPRFASAVEYAREVWFRQLPASADVHARDFVCLAACELWKRWRPEMPSQEMLLEAQLLGEASVSHEHDLEAVRHWIRFWDLLRPKLTPEMCTTEVADALLDGSSERVFNWAADLALVAAACAAKRDREIGLRAAEVIREVLEQFSSEEEAWMQLLASARSRILRAIG